MKNTLGRFVAAVVAAGFLLTGASITAASANTSHGTVATVHRSAQPPAGFQAKDKRVAAGTVYGPFNMCLTNDCVHRWKSNGTGNQVTLSNSAADYMTVYWILEAYDSGVPAYGFQNGNGHCLYDNSSGALVVGSNNGCEPTRQDEIYDDVAAPNNGRYLETFGSIANNNHFFIFTFNNNNGNNVWGSGAFVSGGWYNWNIVSR